MGQVRVQVGGRSYVLACKDGDEPLIEGLAAKVDAKARDLSAQLGHLPETRMLLMAAIMIAEEAARGTPGSAPGAADDAARRAAAALSTASDRIEAIAAALEAQAKAT